MANPCRYQCYINYFLEFIEENEQIIPIFRVSNILPVFSCQILVDGTYINTIQRCMHSEILKLEIEQELVLRKTEPPHVEIFDG